MSTFRLICCSFETDVFHIDLDRYDGTILLSEDEQARVGAMGSAVERRRFAARRSARRTLIAEKLGANPDMVRFECGPNAKPFVSGSILHFSASHSGRHGLLAISKRFEIGVDIETRHDEKTLRKGLELYLSPNERQAVAEAGGEPHRLLLRLWTRKEAAAKAMGFGLDGSLRDLDALEEEADWLGWRIRFRDLPEIDGCAASLAVLAGREGATTPATG